MKTLPLVPLLVALAAPLAAQNIDTIGGQGSTVARGATSKASKFRIDTTSILIEYEMFLDVPGVETLTFFAYRLHTEAGTANLVWTHNVPVDGTGRGPSWYSTGPIAFPLVCGNYYLIGAAWAGTVTYYYDRGTQGDPVSFGAWMSGNTPGFPPPATRTFSTGVDVAKYYQRLTTVPAPAAVGCIGVGCTGTGPAPRLVADSLVTRGARTVFHTTDVAAGGQAAYIFVLGGHTLPAPNTVLGCPLWLDLGLGSISGTVPVGANRQANVGLSIPNDPNLSGLPMSLQTVVVGTAGFQFTNALDITVN